MGLESCKWTRGYKTALKLRRHGLDVYEVIQLKTRACLNVPDPGVHMVVPKIERSED